MLKCGTQAISYRILRKQNKHLYFAIKGNLVEVRANPHVNIAEIEQLLVKKAHWILPRLQTREMVNCKALDTVYVWGEPCLLVFEKVTSPKRRDNKLSFPCVIKKCSDAYKQTVLLSWYQEQMQHYLAKQLPLFAEQMQLFPTKVSVRHTTSQWGSCSSRNALSFSLLAAQLPPSIVDYLIVHELAHIRHKHHQVAFWTLVEEHYPDMALARHTLRDYEKRIHKFK